MSGERRTELFTGAADDARVEQLRAELLLDYETAGYEVRKLARKFRLQPDADILDRLDNRMLRARYFSARGISLDRLGELLGEHVTKGRPTIEQVREILSWALTGRRRTAAERRRDEAAQLAEQARQRNVAAQIVEQAEQAVTTFRARVKRGTKLMPWICDCSAPAAWASFAVDLSRFACTECGARMRRKVELPTLDLEACERLISDETPF